MWANIGYGVCGVLALLMLTQKPVRLPKVAVVLAAIAGFGFAGWLGGLLSSGINLFEGTLASVIGVSIVSLAFFAMLYVVINNLLPKMGKVQGGQVSKGTAVMAALLPTMAIAAGGSIAATYTRVMGNVGDSVTAFFSRGF
jgi:hypothetical protein